MGVIPPDIAFKVVTGLHHRVFDLTNGRLGGRLAGMPVVKLTTTGRRSGQPRDTMLTAPIAEDDRVVVVASKGGATEHPAWYRNLEDTPEVTLTMRGRKRRMVARTVGADEKQALWPTIVSSYRGYGGYQRRTDRDIPVVELTPAP